MTFNFNPNAGKLTFIKSSVYDQAAGTVMFSVDPSVPMNLPAGGKVRFKAAESTVEDSNLTYEVMDMDIITQQYLLSDAQVNSLESKMKRGLNMEFLSWDLERVNMPAVPQSTQYDRQFDCTGGTINALLFTPLNGHLISSADNASSFRWRVNGLETTNRDILLGGALYNDRVMSVLSSGSIKVRNLYPNAFLAGQSLPLSPERQVAQIRLNQGAAASNAKILYLYKQRRRMIKASSSAIQVL